MPRDSICFREASFPSTSSAHARSRPLQNPTAAPLTRAFSSDSVSSTEEFKRKRSSFILQRQETTFIDGSKKPDRPSLDESDNEKHGPPAFLLRRTLFELDMKRSLSESLEYKRLSLDKHLGLTQYQLKLVTQSWRNIYATGVTGPFATNIFPLLCRRNTRAKALMQKGDTASAFAQSDIDCSTMHAKLTVDLIDTIIRNADHCSEHFTDYLLEVGRCHRHLKTQGLDQNMWDDFGEALLESVRKSEQVRRHKELSRAWRGILAFIVDHLKQGQMMFKMGRQSSSTLDKLSDSKQHNVPSQ